MKLHFYKKISENLSRAPNKTPIKIELSSLYIINVGMSVRAVLTPQPTPAVSRRLCDVAAFHSLPMKKGFGFWVVFRGRGVKRGHRTKGIESSWAFRCG